MAFLKSQPMPSVCGIASEVQLSGFQAQAQDSGSRTIGRLTPRTRGRVEESRDLGYMAEWRVADFGCEDVAMSLLSLPANTRAGEPHHRGTLVLWPLGRLRPVVPISLSCSGSPGSPGSAQSLLLRRTVRSLAHSPPAPGTCILSTRLPTLSLLVSVHCSLFTVLHSVHGRLLATLLRLASVLS